MKTVKLFFYIIVLATLVSCGVEAGKSTAINPGLLQVEGYLAKKQSFNNDLVTTAELLANEQVEIMAPISGQVLEIYFKEGENVSEGKPIIRLDDRNWKAQWSGVKAELEMARKDYERKKSLLKIEGSSQEEIDKAYSAVETLKSTLSQLQVNIDLANVKAPFSGQLGLRNFSTGAFLKEGAIITTLTELKVLKVNFTLAQEYLNDVEKGKTVLVLVDNDTLEAKIYAISPFLDSQSRTINLRALLPQPADHNIIPGTFAEVLVRTNSIKDALLVPTQAVVPDIDQQTVFVYKGGKALKKVVTMGNRTADKVHILNGIAPGDTVITTGLLQIKDGMRVKLN